MATKRNTSPMVEAVARILEARLPLDLSEPQYASLKREGISRGEVRQGIELLIAEHRAVIPAGRYMRVVRIPTPVSSVS